MTMGRKRFYDAVRDSDSLCDVQDVGRESKRRLTISSLLSTTPSSCSVCWDTTGTSFITKNEERNENLPFCCSDCLSIVCASCVRGYAHASVNDRSLLPIRCPHPSCRTAVPLHVLRGVVPAQIVQRLLRLQCDGLHGRGVLALRGAARRLDASVSEQVNSEHTGSSNLEAAANGNREEMKDGKESGSENGGGDNNVASNGDYALRTLIQERGWQTCPDCGMAVERTFGCPHMVCFCGGEFCYGCGERWSASGLGCPRRCGLPNDDHERLLTTLPGTFDQLREQLWRRFTALVETFRAHLETAAHSTLPNDTSLQQSSVELNLHRGPESNLQELATRTSSAPSTSTFSVSTDALTLTNICDPQAQPTSPAVDESVRRPVKMRLRSIVHPTTAGPWV